MEEEVGKTLVLVGWFEEGEHQIRMALMVLMVETLLPERGLVLHLLQNAHLDYFLLQC